MNVVLDTVVVLRAYINPLSRWGLLLARHATDYRLVVSPPIVAEYLDVLLRPELTRRFARLHALPTSSLFGLLAQADIVRPDDVPAVTRDPDDDIFFATAKLGNARYIVSEDRDHLDIKAYDGIRIVTAHEFLHILDQKGDEHEPAR